VHGITVPNSGHFIPEEQPEFVIEQLFKFFGGNNTTNTIFYEHAAAQASLYTQSKRLNSWFKVLKTIADRTNKPVISRLVGDLSVELSRAQDILSEKPVDLERLKQINKESTYTYTFTLTS